MSDLRALIESRLVDRGDGTIFDNSTGLLWQQVPSKKDFAWQGAIEHCKSLTLAGYNDWRLPTKEELETLINKEYHPTIDPTLKCVSSYYWSSSILVSDPYYAQSVYFNGGDVSNAHKMTMYFVRAVRGKSNV
jgi:hypothetical protein